MAAPASVREVDPHHYTSRAGVAHLGEAGVGEDLATSDVQLTPGDLLARWRGHRVRLQRPGAKFPGEADRGGGQRVGDPTLAVPLAGHEAGDGPDAVVQLVLLTAAPNGPDPQQAWIGRAWFDRHPADRLLVEVGHESRGSTGSRVVAVGLLAEAAAPFSVAHGTPVAVPRLEALAVALAGIVGGAENRLQVGPRGLVRADDGQLCGRDRLSRRCVGYRHSGSSPTSPSTDSRMRSA